MKKVIFVGGTRYSGSIFVDMTLGNDPQGFSAGEVNALYQPVKSNHYAPVCSCHNKACRLWNELGKYPARELYRRIFDKYPETDFIVDSSKDPLWINKRVRELDKQGIDHHIVLVWKSPQDIARSFYIRGEYEHWVQNWVNYHRLLYTLQPEHWTTLNFHEYATNPASLSELCSRLDIPYFKGKERFWEKSHHLLLGNHSARKHLLRNYGNRPASNPFAIGRTVTYKPVTDPELKFRLQMDLQANPMIGNLERYLKSLQNGQTLDEEMLDNLRMGYSEIKLLQIANWLRLMKNRSLDAKADMAPAVRTPANRLLPNNGS
ncbi:MAG: hypothetical protein KDJ38_15635 [Gammaproteobacteria bacterium]|nr:hypothetical protein [Gammaproteobacteria bacterium]